MSNKKHPILKTAVILGTAVLSVEAVNRFIFYTSEKNNPLSVDEGEIYNWKRGKFFYKKKETEKSNGRPILLIHDLYPDQCAENCESLADQLSKNRTVYTMDLLGCGRSDKPAITYSNFLYVLQIKECIEKIIGQPVHLVAEGHSCAIAVAAARYMPENIAYITLLDPPASKGRKEIPDQKSRLLKKIIQMPVLGTLIYNMAFYKSTAAHTGGTAARFLYASIAGKYTNYDVEWMLQKLEIPIHVIQTKKE